MVISEWPEEEHQTTEIRCAELTELRRKAAAWDALRERVAEARARFPGQDVYLLLDADEPAAYVVDTGTWPRTATPLERRRREEADHA